MKKVLSMLAFSTILLSSVACIQANAGTYNITPKSPKISESLKPMIVKYKQGNYVGAMQDLEELVKTEKNNTYAKYYLALCYTKLGYREEAKTVYQEVVDKNENMALSYYSQRALDCIDNPDNPVCNPNSKNNSNEQEIDQDSDLDAFIKSGKKIHPAAMDRITKERLEGKLKEEEFIRKQKEQEEANGALKSSQPTNEEIATALNTLSKIGLNPYNQFNPLAANQQYNQFSLMDFNNPMAQAYMMSNPNTQSAQAFLLNQITQQQNMMNYGI